MGIEKYVSSNTASSADIDVNNPSFPWVKKGVKGKVWISHVGNRNLVVAEMPYRRNGKLSTTYYFGSFPGPPFYDEGHDEDSHQMNTIYARVDNIIRGRGISCRDLDDMLIEASHNARKS